MEVIKSCEIRISAVEAVNSWNGKEGDFAKELQSLTNSLDEDLWGRWLAHWMVARNIKKASRESLAEYLDEERSKILHAPCKGVPDMVDAISEEISREGWSVRNGLPTSLASKFVFSLRPEIVAPYDRRARCALGIIYRSPIKDHDYATYLFQSKRFARDIDQRLEEAREDMTDEFRAKLRASMSDRLFKLRSADKALMLIGGFRFRHLSRDDVRACFLH